MKKPKLLFHILNLTVLMTIVSCSNNQEFNITLEESDENLKAINDKYSYQFREPLKMSGDTLYCFMNSVFDEGNYHEVLATILLTEGDLSMKVQVVSFDYDRDSNSFISYVRIDENIVGRTLPILKKFGTENALYQTHLYIVQKMTPSDFQVYNFIMIKFCEERQIKEFESGNFYQLLFDAYAGEISRRRFHELMDIFISWSNQIEKETSEHFEYFKNLFPIVDSKLIGPDEIIFEEQ